MNDYSILHLIIHGNSRIKLNKTQGKSDRLLVSGKQYVTFIEPHGLVHEGPASEKILFYQRIKDVETRLNDPDVILNSFILSWTSYPQLKWDNTQPELEAKNVLFMTDDRDHYIDKLFAKLKP
jgi:hypothetical protein